MKTVIYLDVLLLTNFLAAYFLLLATAAFSGLRTRFGRLVLGSLVAALSSLILFVPEQPYPVQLLYKIATALLITAVAFGCSNKLRLLTAACWYAALNIALAGLVLLVILHTGTKILQTGNLTVYLRISPLLLVVLSGVCCVAVEIAIRFLERRKPATQTVGLELELADMLIHLRATLDTGCHLTDPITCLPVLVVSFPDAKIGCLNLFGNIFLPGLPGTRPVNRLPGSNCASFPAKPRHSAAFFPDLLSITSV